MGILLGDARLLFEAKAAGVRFDRTLTLGRQQLFLEPAALAPFVPSAPGLDRFLAEARHEGPADPLFTLLGCEELVSMDASPYEGAKIVHDLNMPVPRDWQAGFDVVVDGGTLEHVFNFPVGLSNAMSLVKPGGHLVLLTPANNYFGHGFYQFSPELFFNVLSEENGYRVKQVVAMEQSPGTPMYDVSDPGEIRSRVLLTNAWPVLLFVLAERVREAPLLERWPMQSDYSRLWQERADQRSPVAEAGGPGLVARTVRQLAKRSPELIARFALDAKNWIGAEFGFRNRRFFKPRD
jgi:hypothetical protein